MMNFKIGNDIIETERIKYLLNKFPDRFKNKIYTEKEALYCESKGKNKYQSYAARFAAKEAVFKAVSPALSDKYSIGWKDIEILNDRAGRPYVNIKNVEDKITIDLSLSHIKDYAIATAIVVIN